MKKLIQAVVLVLVFYLILKIGIPALGSFLHHGTWPVVPTNLMWIYVFFIITGVLLYLTFNEESAKELGKPIKEVYGNPEKGGLRIIVIAVIALFGGYITYQNVKPSFEAPVELRSIHPAPPSSVEMWGKPYNLLTLTNPFRADKANFEKNVREGGIVYFKNCFYCHGDKLDGKGHYYSGLSPLPANFVDVGTIAQLQESFLFWRIGTGGPGLPKEGAPWRSAMPIWQHFLSEEEIWKVILFLYDYTGHSPRTFE
ncbi:MAG: cytochrome c [Nitrospinae bacterium]|nr:cytochrome c [Nitrospinota bacterium]MBI3813795.1 cytochrome c [Nitrospinota bacterium]